MHLWQIRHIPNRPQTLLKLTISVTAVFFIAVSHFATIRFVAGQSEEPSTKKGTTAGKTSAAAEFLDRVRQDLPKRQSVKADLTQVVSIGDQQFKVAGKYVSSGSKLMLRYLVTPDQGTHGEMEMFEVCDGKELWTMMKLPPEPARVTHRNVEQILAAVAAGQRALTETSISIELGMGGLNALLASLDRMMVFDAIKQDDSGGHPQTVVQGHWKPEMIQQYRNQKDGSLPAFLPDLVRLYVNSETLFPERVLYLKRHPDKEKKTFKPLVSLEFRNVELDVSVDDNVFEFKHDPDVIPEDVTKFYIDRISPPSDGSREKKSQ